MAGEEELPMFNVVFEWWLACFVELEVVVDKRLGVILVGCLEEVGVTADGALCLALFLLFLFYRRPACTAN
jgi:hypothetical protein